MGKIARKAKRAIKSGVKQSSKGLRSVRRKVTTPALKRLEKAPLPVRTILGGASFLDSLGVKALNPATHALNTVNALRVGDALLKGDFKKAGKEFAYATVPGLETGAGAVQFARKELKKRKQHGKLSGEQQRQQTDLLGEGSGTGESLVAQAQERTGGGLRLHRAVPGQMNIPDYKRKGVMPQSDVGETAKMASAIEKGAKKSRKNKGINLGTGGGEQGMVDRYKAVKDSGVSGGQ